MHSVTILRHGKAILSVHSNWKRRTKNDTNHVWPNPRTGLIEFASRFDQQYCQRMAEVTILWYRLINTLICSSITSSFMAGEAPLKSMDEIKWFHSIPLGDGVVTPGIDASMAKLNVASRKTCLETVLDIGAWDGFSFQAEKAGASVYCRPTTSLSGPG